MGRGRKHLDFGGNMDHVTLGLRLGLGGGIAIHRMGGSRVCSMVIIIL